MEKMPERLREMIRRSPLIAIAISGTVSLTPGVVVSDLRASARTSTVASAGDTGVQRLLVDDLARQRAQNTFVSGR